jgi:hypothetical protein
VRSRKNARGCDLKPEQLVRNPACLIGCAAMGRSVAENAEEALLRRPFFAEHRRLLAHKRTSFRKQVRLLIWERLR